MNQQKKHLLHNPLISLSLILLISVILTIIIFQKNNEFEQKLTEQQADYNAQIEKLSQALTSDMSILQNLISNVDKENKKRDNEILDLISKLEAESKESIEKAKSELQSEIASIETLNTDFSGVAQEALNSVVSVLTNKGQGSGAIISSDGEILTNYHVIQGASAINVLTYDKKVYRVNILGYDSFTDIAVLKINTNETFDKLRFGNSDDIKIGQSVVALGNPFGLDFTVTQGIVSAKRTASNGIEYIQIDVPINPGNSGGPVVDAAGEIIGIANFRIQGAEGIGFAIPSNKAKESVYEIT